MPPKEKKEKKKQEYPYYVFDWANHYNMGLSKDLSRYDRVGDNAYGVTLVLKSDLIFKTLETIAKKEYKKASKVKKGVEIDEEEIKEKFKLATLHKIRTSLIVDSILEEFEREDEDNLILRSIEQLQKGNINPKLFDQLIERHENFKGKVESKLDEKNVLAGYENFILEKDGSPKIYKYEKMNLRVIQLTDENQLELEGYLNNHCIGRETQNYKKGLKDGSLAFFSVCEELEGTEYIDDIIRKYGGGANEYRNAENSNPQLSLIKPKRNSILTIEYQRNTGKIAQIRFNTNREMRREEYDAVYKYIIKDLYLAINARAEEIGRRKVWSPVKSFGPDLRNLNILGKFLTIEGEDKTLKELMSSEKEEIIISGDKVHVSKEITAEQFKKICNLSNVVLDLSNIESRKDLFVKPWKVRGGVEYGGNFGSVNSEIDFSNLESVGGDLEIRDCEAVNLKSLSNIGWSIILNNTNEVDMQELNKVGASVFINACKHVDISKLTNILGGLNFTNANYINLKNLERIENGFNSKYSRDLNLNSLKEVGGGFDCENEANLSFPSLEIVGKELRIPNSENLQFPKLKKIEQSLSMSSAKNINFDELEHLGGYIVGFESKNINFKKLNYIGGHIRIENSENIIFERLVSIDNSIGAEGAKTIRFFELKDVSGGINVMNTHSVFLAKLESANLIEAEKSKNLNLQRLNWASIVKTSPETEGLVTNDKMMANIKVWNKTM